MFEKAIRMKLRFNFKGICTVEDLWDLSLEDLNEIYKAVNSKLDKDSLLKTQDDREQLKVDIIKHIFKAKHDEQTEAQNQVLKAQKKQRLLQILSEKKDEEFKSKSADELEKIISEM